jgi:hypothetical protein
MDLKFSNGRFDIDFTGSESEFETSMEQIRLLMLVRPSVRPEESRLVPLGSISNSTVSSWLDIPRPSAELLLPDSHNPTKHIQFDLEAEVLPEPKALPASKSKPRSWRYLPWAVIVGLAIGVGVLSAYKSANAPTVPNPSQATQKPKSQAKPIPVPKPPPPPQSIKVCVPLPATKPPEC